MIRVRRSPKIALHVGFAAALLLSGCEKSKSNNPFDPSPSAAKKPPPLEEPAKPSGPPQLVVGADGPKIGWTAIAVDKPEVDKRMAEVVSKHAQHFAGKELTLVVDRKAKLSWVSRLMKALETAGATGFSIRTETRAEYPKTVTFASESAAANAPGCTPVATVLEDRSTAVWRVAGGTASRRKKGMAGPDLTMTAETLERFGTQCKASQALLVGAAEGVEWGLLYDLAASASKLQAVRFNPVVLLESAPVAGRPVKL